MLNEKISEFRQALDKMIVDEDLCSAEILKMSAKLDELINEYYRICQTGVRTESVKVLKTGF